MTVIYVFAGSKMMFTGCVKQVKTILKKKCHQSKMLHERCSNSKV